MMEFFILGILSSIIASGLVYIFRFQIGIIVNILFFKVYPKVAGEYHVYPYEFAPKEPEEDEALNTSENDEQIAIDDEVLNSDATDRELLDWLKEGDENDFHIKIHLKQFANRVKENYIRCQMGKRKFLRF